MKKSCAIILLFLVLQNLAIAKDHLIYSVSHDLPMGYENEIIRSNYYVNLGSNQGVTKGTFLDVYRTVSKQNPYNNKRRVNYQVKIGELKVIHSEEEAAIALIENNNKGKEDPILDVEGFMIGDKVVVNVEK